MSTIQSGSNEYNEILAAAMTASMSFSLLNFTVTEIISCSGETVVKTELDLVRAMFDNAKAREEEFLEKSDEVQVDKGGNIAFAKAALAIMRKRNTELMVLLDQHYPITTPLH